MSRVEIARIPGVHSLNSKKITDERGYFEKFFDKSILESMHLNTGLDSIALSSNKVAGTLRGLHFQTFPFAEEKIVVCISGSIFDVVVDLRVESPTYRMWGATSLDSEEGKLLYLPKGVAHGFQTLVDNSKVLYAITSKYNLLSAHTLSYSDTALNISWPLPVSVISNKDETGVSLEAAVDLWAEITE